jgi:uncharacterized membrane protein
MPMYWNDGYGWAGFFWMVFWMVVWLGLLSLVIWAIMRAVSRQNWPTMRHEWRVQRTEPTALEILNRRYALGELDVTTYEAMRERIQASATDDKPVAAPGHR